MTIRLYNTMSRKIEEFKPLVPGKMGFYSCGPTVYWDAHIGNMRTFVNNDIIKRVFIENGYDVTHVTNITDVGHLTSDEDDGDDKMEKGAARENVSVWDIAKKYTDAFLNDADLLNIIRPTFLPRATDHIAEQIALVQELEKMGYTYEIPGNGIYYDTSRFAAYGALGGQNLSELRGGARIDDTGKRNPTDFALWKFSPTDAKRAMEWDSPWGVGFPGWHIECSAMSMKYLGAHFDIHTGGQEHTKVHHTNEIAQAEPIVGNPWVSYWVHYAWLLLKDGKMSKSAGTAYTVRNLIERGYDPMAFRYLLLQGHYRQPLEFSFESLDAAANGYKNIVRRVADILSDTARGDVDTAVYDAWHDKILAPASDNFKTAESLVVVQELLKDATVNPATKIALFEFIDRLLGAQFIDRAKKLIALESETAPAEIVALAASRAAAKASKDWATADALRSEIDAAGWTVLDSKDGYKIVKKA
ncbi:MAG: cysteine--tRNA ligase [Alphaproteobacteria bacterium]|nr:cysteine--tRNA ligase [Alphaproteobacteria bacterium]